jgi:hypothetical protein
MLAAEESVKRAVSQCTMGGEKKKECSSKSYDASEHKYS